MSPRALTFAAQGGSVIHFKSQHALTDDDVRALADTFWDERIAAQHACDGAAFIAATRLQDELLDAFFKAREWRRASGVAA